MKLMARDAHPAGQVFDEQLGTRQRVGLPPKTGDTKPLPHKSMELPFAFAACRPPLETFIWTLSTQRIKGFRPYGG